MLTPTDLNLVDAYVNLCSLYGLDTKAHLDAVGELAEQLARSHGLDEASVQRCRVTGRLHDLGFIGVERSLLATSGMLVDAEWEAVMRHPQEGARILRTVPGLIPLSALVEAHHERVDGTGYPHGLFGSEIPIESRIVSIADAFHAMTVPQPYRDQLAPMAALDEIAGNAGSQFDVDLVGTFLSRFHRWAPLIRTVA